MKKFIIAIFKLVGGIVGAIVGLMVAVSLLSNDKSAPSNQTTVTAARQLDIRCEEGSKIMPAGAERNAFYDSCIAGGASAIRAQERINREESQNKTVAPPLIPQQSQVATATSKTPGSKCISKADKQAVDLLMNRTKSEHLYESWTTMDCLEFVVFSCDQTAVEITIFEIHNEKCGGDPETGPKVDSFSVDKKSQRIEWYNDVNSQYLDFSKIHSIGSR